jgi:hypothetical protein
MRRRVLDFVKTAKVVSPREKIEGTHREAAEILRRAALLQAVVDNPEIMDASVAFRLSPGMKALEKTIGGFSENDQKGLIEYAAFSARLYALERISQEKSELRPKMSPMEMEAEDLSFRGQFLFDFLKTTEMSQSRSGAKRGNGAMSR